MGKERILALFVTLTFIFLLASVVSGASDDHKTLGDISAKLTMEIYTDFQDPSSAKWYERTLPQLKEAYIENKELRIIFRHFPLSSFHTDAMDRAKATECAAEQRYFFAFVEKFYNNLDKDADMDYYKAIAENLAVDDFDFADFKECFNDDKTEDKINSEFNKGESRGVKGTPTFFINDQQINGAQLFSEFKRVIDPLLGNAEDDRKLKPEDMQREPIKLDNEKRKVHIVGYMGYNDPFSKRAWETINELFKEFDRDDVSFEFRNFPLTFQDSEYLAAQAGECVYSLGDYLTFFEYSDKLMKNKDNNLNTLITEAESLGLDSSEMQRCLTEKKFLPEVSDDLKSGEKDGVQGTPTFFINGKKVSGAQPYVVFAKIIKKELGETSEEPEIPTKETPSEDAPVSGKPTEIEYGQKCISGCQLGNSCLQFGQRIEMNGVDSYCSFSGGFEKQKQLREQL